MLAGPAQGRAPAGGLRRLLPPLVLLVVLSSAQKQENQEKLDHQEVLQVDSTESPVVLSDLRVSPQSSWLVFRRNNKGENRRSRPARTQSKHGLPGPPGPPGPQGPPGPPAPPLVPQEELIQDLQLRVRDLAAAACAACEQRPRVAVSFHSKLLQQLHVPRRSLLELQPYSQPSDSERSLQRGRSFNGTSGHYTAPVSGFYQLTASLLIELSERVQVRLKDSVRASICIQSLCQANVSVESVMGVRAGGGVFSILLTGTLYLQVGEYVSVFVDNASGSVLNILDSTLFSGILLGV